MYQNKIGSNCQTQNGENISPESTPLGEFKELCDSLPNLDFETVEKNCDGISGYDIPEQYKQFSTPILYVSTR